MPDAVEHVRHTAARHPVKQPVRADAVMRAVRCNVKRNVSILVKDHVRSPAKMLAKQAAGHPARQIANLIVKKHVKL